MVLEEENEDENESIDVRRLLVNDASVLNELLE